MAPVVLHQGIFDDDILVELVKEQHMSGSLC